MESYTLTLNTQQGDEIPSPTDGYADVIFPIAQLDSILPRDVKKFRVYLTFRTGSGTSSVANNENLTILAEFNCSNNTADQTNNRVPVINTMYQFADRNNRRVQETGKWQNSHICINRPTQTSTVRISLINPTGAYQTTAQSTAFILLLTFVPIRAGVSPQRVPHAIFKQ